MSKLNKYYSGLSDEDRILVSHILDMISICEKSFQPRFSGFLDERQIMLAQSVLNGQGVENGRFFGGYENASRKVLGIFPPYSEDEKFPVSALTFKFRENDRLTHRDFLGVFMSRQIKRDTLGDIIVGKGTATAFVYDTVKQTLLSEITKIGSVGVKVREDDDPQINTEQAFIEKNGTVSSMRLDSVFSVSAGISREKASSLIKSGAVSVKYNAADSPSHIIEEGDVFSVRGFGKFILFSVNGKTKKDRYHITVRKFV